MAITRITPWSVVGPAANYGLAASLSGASTNTPAGALIVTSVQSASATAPTVSDTAGNTYAVVAGASDSAHLSTWLAYCLSSKADTTNITTWTAASAVLADAEGATYSTSSGTWAFGSTASGYTAYATALPLTISITGPGVLAGGFGEYEAGVNTFTVSGLTIESATPGSANIGSCCYADDIATGALSGYAINVSDNNATYGGYICGIVGAFTVASSAGSNALVGASVQSAAGSGTLSIAVPVHAVSLQAQGAQGSLTVQVPLSGYATATQQADGSLRISVPLSAASVQTAMAQATLGVSAKLAGVSAQQATAAASLSLHVALAGEQLQQAVGVATLTNTTAGAVNLSGSSGQSQAAQGALLVSHALQGASLAISTGSGSVAVEVPMSASSVQASRATGALSVGVALQGVALQSALAQATLSNAINLSGSSATQQGSSGTLLLHINLDAASVQQVSSVATLGIYTAATYIANRRYYAADAPLAFYAAPLFSAYAAAPPLAFYANS